MRALLLLVLAVLAAGCNPYMAAVSLATQTYGIATDMRSVSTQASDTAIEAQIKTALLTSPVAGTSGITVYCRQGVVVLAAALPSRSPAGFAAVQIARGTSGVVRVETFYVNVQPSLTDDLALKAQIKSTLISDPRLIAGQVDVGVYGGHVLLVGVVDSWQKVEDFREDVRSVPGVVSVHSYIQVGTIWHDRLIGLAVAVAFALTVAVPGVWAQGAAAPAQKQDAAKKDSEKLDLNTASAADLKGAGFSEAEAKKIVDGRPYKRKDELVKTNILIKEKYDHVKENIIAHQVKSETKKK